MMPGQPHFGNTIGDKVDRWLSYINWTRVILWLIGVLIMTLATGDWSWGRFGSLLAATFLIKVALG